MRCESARLRGGGSVESGKLGWRGGHGNTMGRGDMRRVMGEHSGRGRLSGVKLTLMSESVRNKRG